MSEKKQQQEQPTELPFIFSFEKIENKSFCVVKSGNKEIHNPTSVAIAFYGWVCCVPKLESVSDIDELWFRMTYLRNIGMFYYENEGDVQLHCLEPIYSDVVNHKGTTVDVAYIERKKWMNNMSSMVINLIRKQSELSKSKIPYEDFLDLREETMQFFINQNKHESTES